MLITGIDPSARKIAIVSTHPTLKVSFVKAVVLYKSTEKQTPESLGRALDAMDEYISWADATDPRGERYAWVEDPVVGRGAAATIKQTYVNGVIRASLVRAGFRVYGAHPSTWKSQVLGTNRVSKAQVKARVRVAWPKIAGLVGNDGDLADAAAICLYGQSVLKTAKVYHAGLPRGAVRAGGGGP